MKRIMIGLVLGLIAIALTLFAFLPAAWLSPLIEKQTGGRIALGDAQGTVWEGSAFIGGAPGVNEPVTPLPPGRFSWSLSPVILLGQLDAELENPLSLSQAVKLTGSWHEWQVSPAAVVLPAERLAGLGAPLNTLQPSGQMRLSWTPLQLARDGNSVALTGSMLLEMTGIASRLSPIKPLGAYNVALDWRGREADMTLKTVEGPLLLSGSGTLVNGRLQFSGRAEAEASREAELANLLNLLGQRRREGNKNFIALEFR